MKAHFVIERVHIACVRVTMRQTCRARDKERESKEKPEWELNTASVAKHFSKTHFIRTHIQRPFNSNGLSI